VPDHSEADLRAVRKVLLENPVSISANGGWLAFDTPLVAGMQSTLCFFLWLVDDGSMQGAAPHDGEATSRHITQTARDSLANLTPNLRVSRPKGSLTSKFYLSGPRSVSKRSLQGAYSQNDAAFSQWQHVCLALNDRTVQLLVDGKNEASYTVQGDVAKMPPEALHEAVLFGSGDDFNGASALIDGVVMYSGITLSPNDAKKEKTFHTPLLMPPTLKRPLVDTGADLIFDQAITVRLEQLVLPEHSTPSHTASTVTQDILAHYLVAHSLGCERAHLALGHRHMYGIGGVARSCEIAAHYYLFAAEKGIDEMIQSNVNTTRDVEFALERTKSSQQAMVDEMDHFGGILGDEDQLVKRMKLLAEQPPKPGGASGDKGRGGGDAAAQYWLAKHYYWGRAGLPLNFTQALHYNRMAAQQGHAEALQFMGILYAKGHGIEPNAEVGLDYSTRAANKGNLAAHNTIGYYHERQGDYITALKHFKQAADQNNSYGHYNIALLYSDGLGTLRQDKEKALKHFIIAAELGHPSCMLMMGFYYLGLTDELGDPVTAGPRQPRDCASVRAPSTLCASLQRTHGCRSHLFVPATLHV
jgi:TPR repeat protein